MHDFVHPGDGGARTTGAHDGDSQGGELRSAVADIESRIGPIEVLVNNAGLQHREPLLEVSLDNWNRVLQVDLTSAFLVGREVARHQLVRGSGKIINICSVQTDLARPSIAAYTAAKGGCATSPER